jgi:hypothetical protein
MQFPATAVFDVYPYRLDGHVLITRKPRPQSSLVGIVNPLSDSVWLWFTAAILTISLVLTMHSKVHNRLSHLSHMQTKSRQVPLENFVLYPLAGIRQPFPFPWLHESISGKSTLLLWGLIHFFFVSFYNSTLRASLIAIEYEKPAKTLQDVANAGKPVFIHTGITKLT